MHSKSNADRLALIQGLEDVNNKVRVVQAAWTHFSQWQEIGGRCEMSAGQLTVARSLLIESIEEWAFALSRLLGLTRGESGFERLTENLERSLRCTADYLGGMAAIDRLAPLYVQIRS